MRAEAQRQRHGTDSFLWYQELVKAEAAATSLRVRDDNFSYLRAGKSMQTALLEKDVTLHKITSREYVKKALDSGCVGIDPQRSGGQPLSSAIEKQTSPTW